MLPRSCRREEGGHEHEHPRIPPCGGGISEKRMGGALRFRFDWKRERNEQRGEESEAEERSEAKTEEEIDSGWRYLYRFARIHHGIEENP